jgi:hypothetical protein
MSRLIPAFIATLPIAALLLLAGLPALLEQSWRRFLRGLLLTPVAVLLPLAFFVLSAALSPEAKSVNHHGALDCFLIGKLALTPLVFWATAALYAVEILEVRDRSRPWIIYGLIFGAIVSSVCTAFGVIIYWHEDTFALICLLVPLYTSIWYSVRAVQTVRNHPVDSGKLTIALASSLPLWAVSALWSYKTYLSLPDQVQDCFVVTAASRGHQEFVGPFLNVPHRGRNRIANQQLATLWAFEVLWRNAAPRTHGAFRSIYNLIGPVIARRITSPWTADVFYLALKPAEFLARFLVNASAFQRSKLEPRRLGSCQS